MKHIYLFGLLIFLPFIGFSQGEWNNWIFGHHAGITFNFGSPVPLTNCSPLFYSQFSTLTVSDSLGNILFYGDNLGEENVYNRNNVLMLFDETPADQGFCPPGWHIPTETDWNTLFAIYINNAFAGSPLKYSGYSGFNALLSGARYINKDWDFQGFATSFWSSTTRSSTQAWAHGMNEDDPSVSVYPASRANAFSVRCLKD